ncbi:MAG: MupA/Atu3671 family FMN-dependent luciferase-like monooxygenase [Myxococcota bacterium]
MSFTTYLMGAESLLVQCAEILLQRGHSIRGVVTDNRDIVRWAEERSIVVLKPGKGLAGRITEEVDWFFSIANLRIISDDVLAKAKRGAINFHDGPLPAYAGVNAPNWALLNQESQHGITWHRIEEGVDEGRILAQRFFPIPPFATALELNRSCYEAAIESFPSVLERLETGDDAGDSQDLSLRSYFGKHDRPDALALIDWRKDAEDAVRLVRALDYGRTYPNPLHLAKIVHDGRTLMVTEAEIAAPSGAAGTVLEATPAGAVVAAANGSVRITRLVDTEGREVCPSTLKGELDVLNDDERAVLTEANKEMCRFDEFWGRRLERLDPVVLPAIGPASEDAPRITTVDYADPTGEDEALRWTAGVVSWLSRVGAKSTFTVGYRSDGASVDERFFAPAVPLKVDASGTLGATTALLATELQRVTERKTFATDLVARRPRAATGRFDIVIAPSAREAVGDAALTIARGHLYVDLRRVGLDSAKAMARRLEVLLAAAEGEETQVAELPLLTDVERRTLLFDWNATTKTYDAACMHTLFEAQVDRTPDAVAVVCEGKSLTYRELDEAANRVAHVLRGRGVQADDLVGLYCYRSLDLLIGAYGILKAGGAYLPLDPDYPEDRISLYLEDSRAKIVVSNAEAQARLHTSAEVLVIDTDQRVAAAPPERVSAEVAPHNLAYVIYTSGSTGRPKGVMIEHRNVANFFAGMDDRVPSPKSAQGVWLAVTSLSFDISVLELFWTLARGFKVVVHRERERVQGAEASGRPMGFGIFYWGNDDGQGPKKYELLLEGAKLGDRLGFTSLWTPERHFHAFGGPYPNPAVTGAAVAAVTKNLDVRAGSCVSPLHHPARIAEEWAVIDNLTGGRTGLAFASGWQPDDFVLRPENTPPKNKPALFASIETVRRLWRGEAVEFPKENGEMHAVVSQPRPVSKELQVWVTTAGNPATYEKAGEIGAHVLTHLLGQSIEEVADKIRIYRDALRKHGHDPAKFKVTLMLHTYLAPTREEAREVAREPMKDYLRSAAGLIKQYAWAFPAFKKPEGVSNPFQLDLSSLNEEEMDAILEFAFTRYFDDSGLFGTVDDAVQRVNQLKAVGIDEVACLIDYGIQTPVVLESMKRVGEVIRRTSQPAADAPTEDYSVPAQLEREKVTHLQCTPSMARLLTLDDRARASLNTLDCFLIGGEALPGALVAEVRGLTQARIENMYGPTETTIWSSTQEAAPGEGITPIGTPIANTQLYVLDAHRQPVPVGVPGELYIGGDGVTRGYLYRDELTKERFLPDPFRGGEHRMYRTGDLVRWRSDGTIDFLGRVDHQVKLRGYRIELGEIESRLHELASVREAVVVAREDAPGDKRLVAYLTVRSEFDTDAARVELSAALPEYMVPSHFVVLDSFPLTPNAKVDRKKLPRPDEVMGRASVEFVAPENETQERIAEIWKKVLGVRQVGTRDNFFELGGHSLLAVQVHRELKSALGASTLAITDIFRFPTLGALADHLGGGKSGESQLSKTAERAAKRREMMRRRRRG